MSLSLPVAIAAVSAGRVAVEAAQQLTEATGFADLFRSRETAGVEAATETKGQSDGPLAIGKLKSQLQEALRQFHSRLRSQLRQAGINTALAFRLRPTATGVAVEDHPQAEQIEQLISQSPQLTSDARYAASMGQMLRSAEDRQSGDQLRSPFGPRQRLSLRIDEDRATVSFD